MCNKRYLFFENKISVQIPDCYQEMRKEAIEAMFPYEDRPEIILSNSECTRFCTFSYLKDQKLTHSQTEYAIKEIAEMIIRLYPSALLCQPQTMVLPNGNIGWFEYWTKDRKDKIHNFMYVFSIEGSMVLGTMGCCFGDEEGKAELKKIMGSIEHLKKTVDFPGVQQ